MIYVLDTHAIVWFLEASGRLGGRARELLLEDATTAIIPTIVLAEIRFLYAKKRITITLDHVYRHIIGTKNSIVYPLDEAVVAKMPTDLEIHDAIIVATGLLLRENLGEEVSIITRDEAITRSGLLPTVW